MDYSEKSINFAFHPERVPPSQSADPFAPCRHNDGCKTPRYSDMTFLVFGMSFPRSVMVADLVAISRLQAMRHLSELEGRRR